jgi:hypothetical protein
MTHSTQSTRRLFLASGAAASVFGALRKAAAFTVPALQPLTAAEYVQQLRAVGNTVGLTAWGDVYIRGFRYPEPVAEFDARLRLWADACRARGHKYIDEVAEYLDGEKI